ncbi:MAG: hypothetical protein AAFP86_22005 [Planctomycetota bacterium]
MRRGFTTTEFGFHGAVAFSLLLIAQDSGERMEVRIAAILVMGLCAWSFSRDRHSEKRARIAGEHFGDDEANAALDVAADRTADAVQDAIE